MKKEAHELKELKYKFKIKVAHELPNYKCKKKIYKDMLKAFLNKNVKYATIICKAIKICTLYNGLRYNSTDFPILVRKMKNKIYLINVEKVNELKDEKML